MHTRAEKKSVNKLELVQASFLSGRETSYKYAGRSGGSG